VRATATPAHTDGWRGLWRHSYRLGLRWLVRAAPRWRGAKVGILRLLVPMDPWRYYELGRVADQPFAGPCLDVSSPKLLTSWLQREGKGDWTGIDLFSGEIEAWRHVDPQLRLEVQDATDLPYADASFDHCICISVIEHVPDQGDSAAMAEMWRVLSPGGILELTTEVCQAGGDRYVGDHLYGEASPGEQGRVFFGRRYTDGQVGERLLREPWEELEREFARWHDPSLEETFYRRAPWSYLYGGLLRLRAPGNVEVGPGIDILGPDEPGALYLRLRKPA
jgi:SAM-dependent methyltransferase